MRARHRTLVAIALLALAVRLIVVFSSPHWVPHTDSANYDSVAVSLVQHGNFGPSETSLTGALGPTAFRAPLYPLALAAVYGVVGVSNPHTRWQAGRVEEAGFGAIAVVLLFLIAAWIWPERRRIAVIAGLLGAVDPPLVLAGSSLMTESLFIPLALGATYCGLRCRAAVTHGAGRRPTLGWALGGGALIALSALTRTTGLVLIVPLALMVWWPQPGRRLAPGSLAVPAVMLAAFVIGLVPWTVRNYAVFHQFVPLSTEAGYALAGIYTNAIQHARPYPALWQPAVQDFSAVYALHPHYDEVEYSNALTTLVRHYVVHHPGSVLRTSWYSLLRMLNLDGFGLERIAARGDAYPVWLAMLSIPAFWLLALAAIAGACTRLARRPGFWFWGAALAMFLICLPVIGTTRYRVPVDPWLVLLAALALDTALARLRPARAPARAPSVPAGNPLASPAR